MIKINDIIETTYNLPILHGIEGLVDAQCYLDMIQVGVDLFSKLDIDPELDTIENPIFNYQHSKPAHEPHQLNFLDETQDHQVDMNLSGEFAIVQNVFMGHYGHNIHDNLPRFEYLRQKFDNKIKFIVTEMTEGMHDTTIQQLRLVHPFYRFNTIALPANKTLKINGALHLVRATSHHWIHESKVYPKYMVKGLAERGSESIDHEHIIFCPRVSSLATHGRCQTDQEVDKTIETIKRVISSQQKPVKFSIFKHVDDDGFKKTIREQREFFRSATVIIGVHGTALTNMLWASRIADKNKPKLQVIECTGNTSAHEQMKFTSDIGFQKTNDSGYWQQFGNHFNVQFHHLFFNPTNLDYKYIEINQHDLTQAISSALTLSKLSDIEVSLNKLTTSKNNH